MLRSTVPKDEFEQLVAVVADKDPDPTVRDAAITQLGSSTDPRVAVSLSNIAKDTGRSQAERGLAGKASTQVAFTGGLATQGCLVMASAPGTVSYQAAGGGVFTHVLLQALEGASPREQLDPERLSYFLVDEVPLYLARQAPGLVQRPYSNCTGGPSLRKPLFTNRTLALIVGIGSYRESPAEGLLGSKSDAERVAQMLSTKGVERADMSILTDSEATRQNVLTSLVKLRARVAATDDFIFYYSGHGWSLDGKAYLAAFDTVFQSDAARLADTGLSLEILQRYFETMSSPRKLILLDAGSTDPRRLPVPGQQ
jgi:hypothetical protein